MANRKRSVLSQLGRKNVSFAVVAMIAVGGLAAQNVVVTDATWNDSEWVTAAIATSSCDDPNGAFATRGEGQLLTGSVLGVDLGLLAEAQGMEVTNNGTRSLPNPSGASPKIQSDSYGNVLNIQALNALNLPIQLNPDLDTNTGVAGQYAQATAHGAAVGASGAVTDSGAISLSPSPSGVPDLAEISLSALLESPQIGLEGLLENVTDLSLVVGALGGRAWVDACEDAWLNPESVTRDYLASHVNLDIESPLVGSIASAANGLATNIETVANGLIGPDNSLLSELVGEDGALDALVGLLVPILNLLLFSALSSRVLTDEPAVEIASISLDFTELENLINSPQGNSVVKIDLRRGAIIINTAELLAEAYPIVGESHPESHRLNDLLPNTNILQDEVVGNTLGDITGDVLSELVQLIEDALNAAVQSAIVTVKIGLKVEHCSGIVLLGACVSNVPGQIIPTPIPWEDADPFEITVIGSVQELSSGQGAVNVSLGNLDLLEGLVEGVLASPLISGIGQLVNTTLSDVVSGTVAALSEPVSNVLGLVTRIYDDLFLTGIVTVVMNAQNRSIGVIPAELSGPDFEEKYVVTAVRVGVLDALGNLNTWVHLGRGEVGENCSATPALDPLGNCAAY